MDEDDSKKVIYDNKAINLLQSALSMDEFFCFSQCTTTKKIWDTLVETHEETFEVKRSRLNSLSQEYEGEGRGELGTSIMKNIELCKKKEIVQEKG